MRCLKHYKAHAQMPDLAFSPDARYPLVNSEKNIFHARYTAASLPRCACRRVPW
jgi:succinyl-diaminopimelate desuccinylase